MREHALYMLKRGMDLGGEGGAQELGQGHRPLAAQRGGVDVDELVHVEEHCIVVRILAAH